jgi:Coenzyme PQQ synthesis protein D (PqqD)
VSCPRLDEAWARSPRMVSRTIGGECVLVPLAERGADLDSVFNLTRVAAFVWETLDGTRTAAEVVDAVVERFEVERERAEADTLELLETLREIRAIVPASPGGRAADRR